MCGINFSKTFYPLTKISNLKICTDVGQPSLNWNNSLYKSSFQRSKYNVRLIMIGKLTEITHRSSLNVITDRNALNVKIQIHPKQDKGIIGSVCELKTKVHKIRHRKEQELYISWKINTVLGENWREIIEKA